MSSGTVVISYDDGDSKDYTSAFPIHQRYGVPAEVCVPSSYVGQPDRLTISQLLEMQAFGWEVVSHTKHHIGLGEVPLVRSASRGTDRLYVRRQTGFKPGIEIRVSDGSRSELAKVADLGADSKGGYLQLEAGLGRNFSVGRGSRPLRWLARLIKQPAGGAVVSLSPHQAREEIHESRLELEAMGLRVRHFTYPWSRFCEWTKDMTAESYDSGRAGGGNRSGTTGDRYALPSTNFERADSSERRVRERLDAVMDRRGLCMLHAHTRDEGFSEEVLERLISECLERGLRVSTRSEYFDSALNAG